MEYKYQTVASLNPWICRNSFYCCKVKICGFTKEVGEHRRQCWNNEIIDRNFFNKDFDHLWIVEANNEANIPNMILLQLLKWEDLVFIMTVNKNSGFRIVVIWLYRQNKIPSALGHHEGLQLKCPLWIKHMKCPLKSIKSSWSATKCPQITFNGFF